MFVATNGKRVYNQCDKNREDVTMKKPTVLMILDGYGLNERKDHNAVAEAKTPVMDKLMAECPFVKEMQVVWPWDFRKDRWVTPRLVI